jgi:hypothetical protein
MRTVPAVLLAVAVLLLAAVPLQAQTSNVHSQRIGGIQYYSGKVGSQGVTGSTQYIGTMGYTNLYVGRSSQSATHRRIGNMGYTNWQDGSSSTSQRIGSFTYTNTSTGASYTTQRIGNFTYTTGSDGYSSMTQYIGESAYTTIQTPGHNLHRSVLSGRRGVRRLEQNRKGLPRTPRRGPAYAQPSIGARGALQAQPHR